MSPFSLHHSDISLSSSRYLSPSLSLCLSLSHTHTHTYTHTHPLTHTLSSLLPSQVSFLTCLFYLSMGSADRLAQDQLKYNYFHQFSSLSVCLSVCLSLLSLSLSLSVDLSFSACHIIQNL